MDRTAPHIPGIDLVLSDHPEMVGPAKKLLSTAAKRFSVDETDRIRQAMETMLILHADEGLRPGGDSYPVHILAVTQRVIEHQPPVDLDVIIASIFHDTVEDEPAKIAALNRDPGSASPSTKDIEERGLGAVRQMYGDRVANAVRLLTNPPMDEILAAQGIDRNHPDYRREKNKLYYDHVVEAIKDHDALTVKIADLAENASSLSALPYQTEAGRDLQRFLAAKYLPVVEHAVELLHTLDRYPEYKQEFKQTIVQLKTILE